MTIRKQVTVDNPFLNCYGDVPGNEIGALFLHRRDLNSIHKSRWPVDIGPEGPYSIILLREKNINDHGYLIGFNTGETQRFNGDTDAEPEGPFNMNLMVSLKSRLPIRMIRASFLKNYFAPRRGFRYDGLYFCKEFEKSVIKDKLVFKFLLSRIEDQAAVPWESNLSLAANSDMLEITAEQSVNKKITEKDALNFQISIDECFSLETERYNDIITSESSDFKEEVVSDNSGDENSCISDQKPFPIDPNVYILDGNVDNSAVARILSASRIISKEIAEPYDYIEVKHCADDFETDYDNENSDNDMKMLRFVEDDYISSSDSEYEDPLSIKMEIKENEVSSVEIKIDNSPLASTSYGNETHDYLHMNGMENCIKVDNSPVSSYAVPTEYENERFVEHIKIDNSPCVSPCTVSPERCSDNMCDIDRNPPCSVPYIVPNDDYDVDINNLSGNMSVYCLSQNSETSHQVGEVVLNEPCNDSNHCSERSVSENEITDLTDSILINGNEVCLMETVESINSSPAQSDCEEVTEKNDINWWNVRNHFNGEIENKVKPQSPQSEDDLKNVKFYDISGERSSPNSYCRCTPNSDIIDMLLGHHSKLFSSYFADFFCKCKSTASPYRTPEIFDRIMNLVIELNKQNTLYISALLVFLLERLDKSYVPSSPQKGCGKSENSRAKPARKRKCVKKRMVLHDENNSPYDLIESEGKFSLVKQTQDFDPTTRWIELDKVNLEENTSELKKVIVPKAAKAASKRKINAVVIKKPGRKRGRKKKIDAVEKTSELIRPLTEDISEIPDNSFAQTHGNTPPDPIPPLSPPSPSSLREFSGFSEYDLHLAENRLDTMSNVPSYAHFPPQPESLHNGFTRADIKGSLQSKQVFASHFHKHFRRRFICRKSALF